MIRGTSLVFANVCATTSIPTRLGQQNSPNLVKRIKSILTNEVFNPTTQ